MSTCARCNGELGRKRWWIDGKEYHEECVRSAEDWKELDRLAEIAMQGLCAQTFAPTCSAFTHTTTPSFYRKTASEIATDAYNVADAMLAERRRRRNL